MANRSRDNTAVTRRNRGDEYNRARYSLRQMLFYIPLWLTEYTRWEWPVA